MNHSTSKDELTANITINSDDNLSISFFHLSKISESLLSNHKAIDYFSSNDYHIATLQYVNIYRIILNKIILQFY